VATKFLEAIRYEKDWRPFAQKHYSQWDLGSRPFIIKFEDFEMQRTGAVSGANVDICTGVYFKLTIPELVGSLPKRSMIARLAVWCETGPMQPSIDGEWGVAPIQCALQKVETTMKLRRRLRLLSSLPSNS